MHGWLQDVRLAVRQALARPGFSLLVILTLALGVGANAAIFSVVNGSLFAPLPYRDPGRLTAIYSEFHVAAMNFDKFWVSAPEYLELQRWSQSFATIGAYRTGAANVGGDSEPVRVRSAAVTASLLTALGVEPVAGRLFTAEEDLPNSQPAVLISERLWRRAFQADPGLVNKTIQVNGKALMVVGVMPASFDLDDTGLELWQPLGLDTAKPPGRGGHFLYLIGRLKDGVSIHQARQEVDGLLARWKQELPDTHTPSARQHPITLRPLLDDLVGDSRPKMLLLAGAVCLVLLLACANVANLLLARAESRQQEVAVRTALGAGQGRLLRQFLTESLLLSLVGGAVGVVLAVWGVNLVLAANPGSVVRVSHVALDARLLAYTLGVAILSGLLFGLAPALHSRGRHFFGALKEGARASAGTRRLLLRNGLVVLQVAVAFLLVIGAGLLLKSFRTLSRVDPGFDPKNVLSFQLYVPPTPSDGAQVASFYDRLLERLRALPSVESAAAVSGLPPKRDVDANDTDFEGVPKPPDGPLNNVDYYQAVSDGYFSTMKIKLAQGRLFEPADAASSTPVVVINQRLADTVWPGQSPLGKRLQPSFDNENPWFTVIGVIADVKQGGLNRPAGTEVYFLNPQIASVYKIAYHTMSFVLRPAAGDPAGLAPAVRATVQRLDSTLPISQVAPMTQVIADSVSDPRLLTLLVTLFGGLALLLAAIGTYGVLSYAVEERRHELGVRLALGAEAGSVLRLVLGGGLRLVAIGLGLGLVAALSLRQVLTRVLFAVPASDPATYLAVAALLSSVALVACLLPAMRAMRVDPVDTLKAGGTNSPGKGPGRG